MSFFDRILKPKAQPPAKAEPPKPVIPEWEKLAEDTIRQNINNGGFMVRVFDFTEQTMVIDGTGLGGPKTMPFSELDDGLLKMVRGEMLKLGGSVEPIVPVQLSEEWRVLSTDAVEQTSRHSSKNGVNTLRRLFDFAKEKVTTRIVAPEFVDITVADATPFNEEDAALVTRARAERAKFHDASIKPFKSGTVKAVIAPQKATFRKKGA